MEFLVPIGVCVVLPVLIVWLVMRTRQNEANRKAEIMLKAIEAGVPVDMTQFNSAKKGPRTIKQELLEKFTGACITTLMGIAFLAFAIWAYYCQGAFDTIMDFYGNMPFGLAGGILLAVGIGLFISYFAGKKMLAKEMEAEEKNLER